MLMLAGAVVGQPELMSWTPSSISIITPKETTKIGLLDSRGNKSKKSQEEDDSRVSLEHLASATKLAKLIIIVLFII
jgi:hypothetical protein